MTGIDTDGRGFLIEGRGVNAGRLVTTGFFDGFEDGDVSEWNVNNFVADNSRSNNGSWSGLATYNSSTNLNGVDNPQATRPLGGSVSEGTRTVTWDWFETDNGNGHVIGLEDSSGTPICAFGSDNPQWVVYHGGGWSTVDSSSSSGRWTAMTINLNFDTGEFDYEFRDDAGVTQSGSLNFANPVPYEQVALRPHSSGGKKPYTGDPTSNNNIEVWVDDIDA